MTRYPLGLFVIFDQDLDRRLEAAAGLGLATVQILAPPPAERDADRVAKRMQKAGLQISAVFCGFEGEDYSSIEAVEKSVGLVPPATRAFRLSEAKAISDFTRALGVEVTALHLGFIGDDPDLVEATRELCDVCRSNGGRLHLETGQESAETLLRFINRVERDNLAINFDPANMILYGSGDPISALRLLGPHVKSVHCKDAVPSTRPGVEWGREVPIGDGDVGFPEFLSVLKEIGYRGPLTIEREISGQQQLRDVAQAVERLHKWRSELLER